LLLLGSGVSLTFVSLLMVVVGVFEDVEDVLLLLSLLILLLLLLLLVVAAIYSAGVLK